MRTRRQLVDAVYPLGIYDPHLSFGSSLALRLFLDGQELSVDHVRNEVYVLGASGPLRLPQKLESLYLMELASSSECGEQWEVYVSKKNILSSESGQTIGTASANDKKTAMLQAISSINTEVIESLSDGDVLSITLYEMR